MQYKLDKSDMAFQLRCYINGYVRDCCYKIAREHDKYPEMSGFVNNTLAAHYKGVESVSIEETIGNDIIVCIKYTDNNKPARVYFVPMTDYESYHDKLVNDYFEERRLIYRQCWIKDKTIKNVEC